MNGGGSQRLLDVAEIVVGAVLDAYSMGTLGNSLIVMGASQLLENLLTRPPQTAAEQSVIRSSVANQQILYGQVCTGGVLMYANAYGSNGSAQNAYLVTIISHSITRQNSAGTAGMPIGGIVALYVNDVEILPYNTANPGLGGWYPGRGQVVNGNPCSVIAGKNGSTNQPWNSLAQNLWMSFSDGSQTAVDPILGSVTPGVGADFIGYGLVYSTWVMFMSADQGTFSAAFPNGINTPGSIKVVLNGQLLYDPRLDGTNGGTGTQRLSDTTTWTYSSNPALVLADYLTRAKTDGGAGYSTSQLDWSSVAAAANVCDTELTVPAYGATWSGTAWSATQNIVQYSFNAAINTATSVDQNVQTILRSMAGVIGIVNGIIVMYAGAPVTSSGPLDESYLAGPAQLTNQIPRNQMWNAVKFSYGAEPQADYNIGQGMPILNTTYETQDGGVRLWKQDSIRGCNNQFQCQVLEIIKSHQSRNKMQLQLHCNLRARRYTAGDVVDINLPELNLNNTPFRILHFTMDSNYGCMLSLQQEDANTYEIPQPPDSTFQAFNMPNYQELLSLAPPAPAAPTNVTASVLSAGILLQWQPPAESTYAYQEIYRSTSPSSGYAKIAGNVAGDSYLDANTSAGTTYYYYIVTVQPYNSTNTMSFVGTPETSMASATSKQVPNSDTVGNVQANGGTGTVALDPGAIQITQTWAANTNYAQYAMIKEA